MGIYNIIGLLYTPFMLREMGQTEYGIYSFAATLIAYLTILDFGLGDALVRYTAKLKAEGKTKEQYSLFGMIESCYLIIGIISIIAGCLIYHYSDSWFGKTMNDYELSQIKTTIIILCFNLVVTFTLSIYSSIIIAYERFIFHRLMNIIKAILQPLIMIPLLLLGYKAIGMVCVITILNILYWIGNLFYCNKKLKIKIVFKEFDWKLLKEIGSYTFYTFIAFIVYKLSWNSGQLILAATSGATAIAIYAVAMQLKEFFSSASTSISSVLLPRITTMVTKGSNIRDLSSMFIRIGRLQYIVLSLIITGFISFGKYFIGLWAGKDYIETYYITLIILIPLIIPLCQNLGVAVLQAQNKLKFRSISYLLISIIGILICFPLSKTMGGIGCAIGTAGSLFVSNVIIMNIYYWKIIKLDILGFWKNVLLLSIPIIICTVIGITINHYFVNSLTSLIISIISYIVIYSMVLWNTVINNYEKSLIINIFTTRIPCLRKG